MHGQKIRVNNRDPLDHDFDGFDRIGYEDHVDFSAEEIQDIKVTQTSPETASYPEKYQTPGKKANKKYEVTTSSLGQTASNESKIQSTVRPEQQNIPHLYIKNLLFKLWKERKHSFCDNSFIGYGNEFALLNDVVVNKQLAVGEDGGKDMSEVMEQKESKEFVYLTKGFFSLKCNSKFNYFFKGHVNYLNKWMKTLVTSANVSYEEPFVNNRFTIALVRFEYVNVYHTMTNWYNTFLLMRFFNHTASETDILFLDAHPKGSLDNVWGDLFHSFKFLSQMKQQPVMFKKLVWDIQGYNSPMLQCNKDFLPYVNEFREFFLSRHFVETGHKLNCQRLNIFFIWRRDYVAHPRNPGGNISRKIKNEDELIQELKQKYPQHNIEGKQLDLLPMKEQLKCISKTDILAGMHGAALTLALFLPEHSGVVELFPNYWSDPNSHFKCIARWRGLHYTQWKNTDMKNEYINDYTRIPPEVAIELVDKIIDTMCLSSLRNKHSNTSSVQAQNIDEKSINRSN